MNIDPSFLTRVLYVEKTKSHYTEFKIDKKSGGFRTIFAPSAELKDIQRSLSDLLLDCKDVIQFEKGVKFTLSHGFEREKSIITNASVHRNKKNVLNLDLEDFFGSINFGRVRGYFISNNNFNLDPHIATVIAQIACHNNSLPQGSPCSPVISNLIAQSLDIKLSKIARKNGCSYTRYADDITFSTRKEKFSKSIVKDVENVKVGSVVLKEIKRSGFSVNDKKTRVLFKDSRQEATGLVINKKVSVKREYWRETRAMAHSLFKKDFFEIQEGNSNARKGTLSELEGRLNFIDSIDHYNNIHEEKKPAHKYELKKHSGLYDYKNKLNSREKVYSKFLYYKYFISSEFSTILTEGKTDNVYLKLALSSMRNLYPKLVEVDKETKLYRPLLKFPNLNSKTRYFLDLDGGASHFTRFVQRYVKECEYYGERKPKSPVIMILDNDDGPKSLLNHLANHVKSCPNNIDSIRGSKHLRLFKNLYLILTPLGEYSKESMMEDLFEPTLLDTKLDGKAFSRNDKFDSDKYYGKHVFSTKVVAKNKAQVNFDGFKYIFDRILEVNKHYASLDKV